MSTEVVDPEEIKNPEKALATINQINFLLRSGDPLSQEQGRQRCWQKCLTLGLKTLQEARKRLQRENPDQVASEMFTDAEKKAWSWRYLISFSSQDALYASFDAKFKVTGLSRGPKASVAVQAARELRSLPETSGGKYRVKVLTIPGLLTEAFWLKRVSGNGPENIVVPFFTSQHLRYGHPYSAGDFLKLAADLAVQRLACEPTQTRKSENIPTSPNKMSAETRPKSEDEASRRSPLKDTSGVAETHGADDIKKEIARRIMAEKRQQIKQAKDASARAESWQRATRKIL